MNKGDVCVCLSFSGCFWCFLKQILFKMHWGCSAFECPLGVKTNIYLASSTQLL